MPWITAIVAIDGALVFLSLVVIAAAGTSRDPDDQGFVDLCCVYVGLHLLPLVLLCRACRWAWKEVTG